MRKIRLKRKLIIVITYKCSGCQGFPSALTIFFFYEMEQSVSQLHALAGSVYLIIAIDYGHNR